MKTKNPNPYPQNYIKSLNIKTKKTPRHETIRKLPALHRKSKKNKKHDLQNKLPKTENTKNKP